MARALRRAGCRLRPRRPFGRGGAGPQLGHVPLAPRGQVRRRLGAHGRRCRLHLQHPQGEGPPALSRAAQGRDARPRRSTRYTVRYTLHRHRRRATCRWWWPACRSCPRPITPRASSTRPRSSRRSAPAPTRSATSGRAPSSATSAATTIGARTSPSTAAASISTSCATSTIATARPQLESLKAGAFDLREEFTARDWVTAYDIPAVKDGRLIQLDAARREPLRRAGLLPQHAPAQVRRRARAQGARLCLRLRVDQQEHLLRSLSRAPRASSRTPT